MSLWSRGPTPILPAPSCIWGGMLPAHVVPRHTTLTPEVQNGKRHHCLNHCLEDPATTTTNSINMFESELKTKKRIEGVQSLGLDNSDLKCAAPVRTKLK
jgi:hypothetical protein